MADTPVVVAVGTAGPVTVMSTIPETEATDQAPSMEEVRQRAEIDESSQEDGERVSAEAAEAEPALATACESTTIVRLEAAAMRPNIFNIIVGPTAHCFSIDINDLRRESSLFRSCTSITSIELRREDPAAVQLIANWFHGNIGLPPLTKQSRDLFVRAARIAQQLQIRECENQLIVIVHKATASLANIVYDQMEHDLHLNPDEIIVLVRSELEGYMFRSVNEGGREDYGEEEATGSQSA